MNNKRTNKLLSVLLAIAMVAGMLIVPAAAEEARTWDFGALAAAAASAGTAGGSQGDTAPAEWYTGITVVSGQLKSHGSSYGLQVGSTTIKVPVTGNAKIEVVSGNSWDVTIGTGSTDKGGGGGAASHTTEFTYEGAAGDVSVVFGSSATTYVAKIVVTPITGAVPASVSLNKAEVLVKMGSTATVTATDSKSAATAWATSVDNDKVTATAAADGTITVTPAKVGKATVTVTATVGSESPTASFVVWVQPATVGELGDDREATGGKLTYDFHAGDAGKLEYYTAAGIEWISVSDLNNGHGPHGAANFGMKLHIPTGKKANVTVAPCKFGKGGTVKVSSGTVGTGAAATGDLACADSAFTVTGMAKGEQTITFTAEQYVHGIEVELLDANADTMSISPVAVTMRAGESKTVTATVEGYTGKSVFAVSENAGIATATVDDKTITITGEGAGTTGVYVVMADAQPTLADAKANGSAKRVAVTVEAALAAGVKEWVFKGCADQAALTAAAAGLTLGPNAKFHSTGYGMQMKSTQAAENDGVVTTWSTVGIPVDGPSIVTVYTGYTWDLSLGDAQNAARYDGDQVDKPGGDNGHEQPQVFYYTGGAGVVTLTSNLAADSSKTATSYIAKITVEPIAGLTTHKVDVWDFGAEELDTSFFNNKLDVATINGWFSDAAGTTGVTLPQTFTGNGLTFVGSKAGTRLRTTNEALTRTDGSNITKAELTPGEDGYDVLRGKHWGTVASNGSSVTLKLTAAVGDKLSFVVGDGNNKAYTTSMTAPDSTVKTQPHEPNGGTVVTYYATTAGEYSFSHVEDVNTGVRPCVARVYRESAMTTTISGSVTVPAGMPSGYKVVLTDNASGVEYEATVSGGNYSVDVFNYQSGTSYTYSLKDADGYIVATNAELALTAADATKTNDIVIVAVELATVTGAVTGLPATELANVVITLEPPADKIYVPKLVPNATTGAYTASFEKGVEYKLTAANVNDYALAATTVKHDASGTADVAFAKKPVYPVTVVPTGLTVADLADATFTFVNVDEADAVHPKGYTYTFTGAEGIQLRDGQYSVKVDTDKGIQRLTPDIKVNGAAANCPVAFQVETPTMWDFSASTWTPEAAASGAYQGLTLTGINHNKVYALSSAGNIKVPVPGNCTVKVSFCYKATGTVGDVAFSTASGSTGTIETASYEYTGAAGEVTVTLTGETYLTKIEVLPKQPYADTIRVGADKQYKTINAALAAVKKMDRTAEQRVTILIDPGDYEEMLRIDVPNVTLKNASATPSIALKNKGVDIDTNAVRITWYYGHGYTYYSMTNGHIYDEEVLAVNKANGYASYINAGTGTTDSSYWNATVSIMASGFQAEGIIFENSFNQYISKKAAQDVIEAQVGAAKEGDTPRAQLPAGSTKVQEKPYVERAAALAIYNDCDKIFFDNCKFIGRQDTLYGGTHTNAGFYNCAIYGGTDYIMGGMTAVFAKCKLVFNTSEHKNDVGYITAPQQKSKATHGYLLYNCTITSTVPGEDTASALKSKPGYLGRPWEANIGEAVFYATNVETTTTTQAPASGNDWTTGDAASLILPAGWLDTLSGKSSLCGEYDTREASGVDNTANRANWVGKFTDGKLASGEPITVATFLGDWDAFAGKNMVIDEPPTVPGGDDVDAAALTEAIAAAKAAKEDVAAIDAEPSGVLSGQKFVSRAVMDALDAAIAKAEAAQPADADAVAAAVAELNAAVETFQAAIQTGTSAGSTGMRPTGSSGSGAVTTGTTTVKNDDGSTVTTATKADGSVEVTTTEADGTKEVELTKPDGTVITTTTAPDGSKSVITENPDGSMEAVITDAQGVKTEAATTAEGETTADITVPGKVDQAVVTVPKKDVTPGTVAVITKADGTEEVIKVSAVDEEGLKLLVKESVSVKLEDRSKSFDDVPDNHWAKDAVDFASSREIFKGTSNTTFAPTDKVNRAMMATVLYRLEDGVAAGKSAFADVTEGAWYSDAVAWASQSGVVTGFTDGTFGPDQEITREQLATMLFRYAGVVGIDTAAKGDTAAYSDAANVSSWATEAMAWAVGTGLITGTSDPVNGIQLSPTQTASRAEAAIIMERMVKLMLG